MAISLYDYQVDAVGRLKNGSILCGGVGSGKSRTALAYYYICQGGEINTDSYVQMLDPKDLYVITTARKRDTKEWELDMAPFLISPDSGMYSHKVVIDSWNNITKYADVTNAFFIFDEQRVVGSGTWVKTFLKITKTNQWILLSATPGDSWVDYIPVFIANGFYKNRTEFFYRHVVYNRFTKFKKIEKYVDQGILQRHRREILVTMDYKKKTASHHETVIVGYDVLSYKLINKDRWNPFKNEPIENASELCQCLRRVSNMDPTRLSKVIEIASEKKKAIIFYNFDYELETLRKLEYVGNPEIAEWNGHKHEPIPKSDEWIYLVQYTAGSEGWNCTETDSIIFFSQSYSYKATVQASGRIDRLNTQYKDLYFYHLRSNSGIDVAINRALSRKEEFNERDFVSAF